MRILPETTAASWGVIGALRPPSRVPSTKLRAFLSFLDDELGPACGAELPPYWSGRDLRGDPPARPGSNRMTRPRPADPG